MHILKWLGVPKTLMDQHTVEALHNNSIVEIRTKPHAADTSYNTPRVDLSLKKWVFCLFILCHPFYVQQTYSICPLRHVSQLARGVLTFAGVDVQWGPDSVSAARRGDGVDTAIKPVASNTLERDAAVVQRRSEWRQHIVVNNDWRTTVNS